MFQHGYFQSCVVTIFCSFFVVAHVSLAHKTICKMVLLKKLACRILSNFALSKSFIMVNAFHLGHIISLTVILCCAFVSMPILRYYFKLDHKVAKVAHRTWKVEKNERESFKGGDMSLEIKPTSRWLSKDIICKIKLKKLYIGLKKRTII